MLLPSRRRLAPVLLVAALAAATVAVAGTGPGAAGMITCEEFVKMKVIDEVKAIAAGRVPRECRDRKTEHQRRDQRKRAASQRFWRFDTSPVRRKPHWLGHASSSN